MQVRWILCTLFLLYIGTPALEAQWVNDQPVWEYEDESPKIPIDVRLKIFNLGMAYQKAGDYHNDHFVQEYTRREYPNEAFAARWKPFFARWIALSDYLRRFNRSVWVNASSVTAGAKTVNIEHSQLGGRTLMVLENLVETARGLTFYLEDDTVIMRWEIFIRRLRTLEEELKELMD